MAVERGVPLDRGSAYLARKFAEASLINRCLAEPRDLLSPATPAAMIDQKFQLAALLRSERSLQSWALTETARPEMKRWSSGAFAFHFGYQRADLTVEGPPIYPALRAPAGSKFVQRTIYTGSGMSALAGVFTTLLRLNARIEVRVPRGFYGETRELIASFGDRIRLVPRERFTRRHDAAAAQATRSEATPAQAGHDNAPAALRVLLLDSCVSGGFFDFLELNTADVDLVLFDTTCFWRTSSRIARTVQWAFAAGLPMALVRSHAKLDCLGIEYGRLGSIVLATAHAKYDPRLSRWVGDVARETRESIRLFGAAPVPAHFPPFTGTPDYWKASAARTAGIIRNTRRLHRLLAAHPQNLRIVKAYQHGLYLTLSPHRELQQKRVKDAAGELCDALAAAGLPVKHAGSFGFDFVAIEWFADPITRRNVIRIAAGDLPGSLMDEIAVGIDAWWSLHMAPAARIDGPDSRSARVNHVPSANTTTSHSSVA